MKQIPSEYRVLSESPKLELFIDYFLKDGVIYATAKVMDEAVSMRKPIWGVDLSIDPQENMSFDELIFVNLNPKKRMQRREQKRLVLKLREKIYSRIEEEFF